MSEDARFEDGREAPLNLKAIDTDDLQVISMLIQDAVFPATEMKWDRGRRRFALLINRFRWEDAEAAKQGQRRFERVQAMLMAEDVLNVSSQGIDRQDKDLILSLLSLEFQPGADGTGQIVFNLAGDGAIALDVETLDLTLKDVTRPYLAPSGKAPQHP